MYPTYHTKHLQSTQTGLARRHGTQIRKVLAQVRNILADKGHDYNNLVTMPEHMPFGDKSWATLIWIKTHRIASVIQAGTANHESLDDSIYDLIVYAVAYQAWRNLKHDEAEIMRDPSPELLRVTGTKRSGDATVSSAPSSKAS